jgi:hypothetical protein
MYSFYVPYIKCVYLYDDLLKRSKHVAPLNTYILSCVNGYYLVLNLKYTGMSNLNKVSYVSVCSCTGVGF